MDMGYQYLKIKYPIFSINCMFEICSQILYILKKIEKSEIFILLEYAPVLNVLSNKVMSMSYIKY